MLIRSLHYALLALLACLVLGQIACSPIEETPVPAELVDVWVTDNEKYADRFFTIRGGTITFGTGEGMSETYIISNVERVPFVGDSLYTIEYVDAEVESHKFSFFFRRGDPDQIRLMHQRHFAWVRRR